MGAHFSKCRLAALGSWSRRSRREIRSPRLQAGAGRHRDHVSPRSGRHDFRSREISHQPTDLWPPTATPDMSKLLGPLRMLHAETADYRVRTSPRLGVRLLIIPMSRTPFGFAWRSSARAGRRSSGADVSRARTTAWPHSCTARRPRRRTLNTVTRRGTPRSSRCSAFGG